MSRKAFKKQAVNSRRNALSPVLDRSHSSKQIKQRLLERIFIERNPGT
jgi:hypothetical protein